MRRKTQSGLGITFRFQGSRTIRHLHFLSYTSLLCFPLRRDIIDPCPSYALRSVSSSATAGSSAPLISSAWLSASSGTEVTSMLGGRDQNLISVSGSKLGPWTCFFFLGGSAHSSAVHPVISHHKHFSISDQVATALSGPLTALENLFGVKLSHPSSWYFDTFSSSRSLA